MHTASPSPAASPTTSPTTSSTRDPMMDTSSMKGTTSVQSPEAEMPADIDGILLLDKPVGLSSAAAVARVKRLFNARKAGHTGSLDPLASGLLPICFGE